MYSSTVAVASSRSTTRVHTSDTLYSLAVVVFCSGGGTVRVSLPVWNWAAIGGSVKRREGIGKASTKQELQLPEEPQGTVKNRSSALR